MRPATAFAALALLGAIIFGFALGYAVGSRPRALRMKQMTLLGLSRSYLLDSLNLTAPQRQRVDGILTGAANRADRSIQVMYHDVRAITGEARESVRATLDAPQRAKLDSVLSTVSEMKVRSPLPPRSSREGSR